MKRFLFFGLFMFLTAAATSAPPTPLKPLTADPPGMKTYETKYYIIHADISPDYEREAAIRMTKMAEEYHARTSDFSGTVKTKMPFYMFANSDDYYAAGALPGSSGVFNGRTLMAIAGDRPERWTWHVVQHEGFHQFAFAMIGGQLPAWLSEGLAEYFGEAIFTGDGYVCGAVPTMRMRRFQAEMDLPEFKSVSQLMDISHEKWNASLDDINYDEAWSLVYFLAHGDEGKYQKTFTLFMQQMNKGKDWQTAWHETFGDTERLDERWRDYWKKMKDRPSDALYARATLMTLTGFLGRCSESKQTFDTFETYSAAIRANELKIPDADWLPPSLITNAAAVAERREQEGTQYKLEGHPQKVTCILPNGTKLTGSYTLQYGKVSEVTVEVADPPATRKSN